MYSITSIDDSEWPYVTGYFASDAVFAHLMARSNVMFGTLISAPSCYKRMWNASWDGTVASGMMDER